VPFVSGDIVVIESNGYMVSERVADALVWVLSATLTVKLEPPLAVGVPLMTPPLDKVRPAGNEPKGRDHV
jgi:hypothetical protein